MSSRSEQGTCSTSRQLDCGADFIDREAGLQLLNHVLCGFGKFLRTGSIVSCNWGKGGEWIRMSLYIFDMNVVEALGIA